MTRFGSPLWDTYWEPGQKRFYNKSQNIYYQSDIVCLKRSMPLNAINFSSASKWLTDHNLYLEDDAVSLVNFSESESESEVESGKRIQIKKQNKHLEKEEREGDIEVLRIKHAMASEQTLETLWKLYRKTGESKEDVKHRLMDSPVDENSMKTSVESEDINCHLKNIREGIKQEILSSDLDSERESTEEDNEETEEIKTGRKINYFESSRSSIDFLIVEIHESEKDIPIFTQDNICNITEKSKDSSSDFDSKRENTEAEEIKTGRKIDYFESSLSSLDFLNVEIHKSEKNIPLFTQDNICNTTEESKDLTSEVPNRYSRNSKSFKSISNCKHDLRRLIPIVNAQLLMNKFKSIEKNNSNNVKSMNKEENLSNHKSNKSIIYNRDGVRTFNYINSHDNISELCNRSSDKLVKTINKTSAKNHVTTSCRKISNRIIEKTLDQEKCIFKTNKRKQSDCNNILQPFSENLSSDSRLKNDDDYMGEVRKSKIQRTSLIVKDKTYRPELFTEEEY